MSEFTEKAAKGFGEAHASLSEGRTRLIRAAQQLEIARMETELFTLDFIQANVRLNMVLKLIQDLSYIIDGVEELQRLTTQSRR